MQEEFIRKLNYLRYVKYEIPVIFNFLVHHNVLWVLGGVVFKLTVSISLKSSGAENLKLTWIGSQIQSTQTVLSF